MIIQNQKVDLIKLISKLSESSMVEKIRSIKENPTESKNWIAGLNDEEQASDNRPLD